MSVPQPSMLQVPPPLAMPNAMPSPRAVAIDTTGDGVLDSKRVPVDTTGDGKLDSVVTVPNPDAAQPNPSEEV